MPFWRVSYVGGAPLFLSQRALDKVKGRASKVGLLQPGPQPDRRATWGWFGSRSYLAHRHVFPFSYHQACACIPRMPLMPVTFFGL